MNMRNAWRLLPAILAVFFQTSPIRAENTDAIAARIDPALQILKHESFPALKLRGYGTVSGEFVLVKSGAGDASILFVHCESVDAARLLSAKYTSDLESIPGVKKVELGAIVAREIEMRGDCGCATRGGRNDSCGSRA
jgi:hypothetical protein